METKTEKKDIYNSQERFEKWKENALKEGIEGLNKTNSKWLLDYIIDAADGRNQNKTKKVKAITLNPKITRLVGVFKLIEDNGVKDISKITENQLHNCFSKIKSGREDKIKDFDAFYHWLMRIQRKLNIQTNGKKGKIMYDITEELSSEKKEENFVYFTLEDLKKVQPFFTQDEQVRNLFMFDTIIRTGLELQNIKVSDCHDDFTQLTIRDEVSKTYGRTIKLLLCSEELKKYVERNKLKSDDFLFVFDPANYNKKMKIIFEQVFCDKNTKGGDFYKNISLYDYRHSGAIHWRLNAYNKKIDGLMYRGGWANLSMLNYYTKKIGMSDSIEKGDLVTELDKNEYDKKLMNSEKRIQLMYELLMHQIVKNKGIKKKLDKTEEELMDNFLKLTDEFQGKKPKNNPLRDE